jgi:hypothetical protein
METMRLELAAEGFDIYVVGINKSDAVDDQQELWKRGSMTLLQDQDDIRVWDLHHQGVKDDFYIYDADGNLFDYLDAHDDARSTNLSTDEGYENVKQAILAAF